MADSEMTGTANEAPSVSANGTEALPDTTSAQESSQPFAIVVPSVPEAINSLDAQQSQPQAEQSPPAAASEELPWSTFASVDSVVSESTAVTSAQPAAPAPLTTTVLSVHSPAPTLEPTETSQPEQQQTRAASPISQRIASITGVAAAQRPANHPAFVPSSSGKVPANAAEKAASVAEALSKLAHVGPPKLDVLKARIAEEPTDGEAWKSYVQLTEERGDLERTRQVYEELLKVFPDSAAHWIAYADLELKHSHFPQVEAIFARCLRTSTAVNLWAFYLTYIRRVNKLELGDPEKTKQSRTVIAKAYEFSLAHIGSDKNAGGLWHDYIGFLRSADATGTWEQQQNMDSVRKAYQQAVVMPLSNVEQIWSEYNHWEQNLNKLTAKKFVGERSAAYMTARSALREMRPLVEPLEIPMILASLPHRPDWSSPPDRQFMNNWRQYLKWEEGNPLQLEDKNALQSRILFAHRKSLVHLRFYPEAWSLASNFSKQIGKTEESLNLLKSGFAANDTSLLLGFAYAEAEEGRRNFEESHKAYDALLSRFHATIARLIAKRDKAIEEAIKQAQQATKNEEVDGEKTIGEEIVQIREAITKAAQPEIDSNKRAAASVWIAQMRFSRRAEGIKQARAVFGRARKSEHLVWQVVEADAMIEYHWNKEAKVATNVFELGLKIFSEEPGYVVRYLDFLINTNDDTNARAVFERTIGKIPADLAKPLWDRWARFENQFGDLTAMQKLDSRIAEAYPNSEPVLRFVERHVHQGLTEMLTKDLGFLPPGATTKPRSNSASSSRSPSPVGRPGKRGPSEERTYRRRLSNSPPGFRRPDMGPKRLRRDSPSPNRRPIPLPGRRPSPPRGSGGGGRNGRFSPAPMMPVQQQPPARDDGISDLIKYFMSILPTVQSFNGPVIPGGTILELLKTVTVPQPQQRPRGRPPGRTDSPYGFR